MVKTLRNFENLTLSDIYHPKFYNIFYQILTYTTIFNSLLFPIMIYIIIKYSTKQMGSYKHLLIIQLLFTYIFGFITFLWKPVLIWPLRQGFSLYGWINFGSKTFYYFFVTEIFLIFGIIVSQFYVILFRIFATLKNTFWRSLYDSTKLFYIVVIISMFIVEIIVIFPIISDVPDPLKVQQFTSEEVPAVKELMKLFPDISGYHPELENGGIEFMLAFGFCLCSLAPFIFIGTIIFFLIRLGNIVSNLSNATYKMEVMLFRALLSQLIILTIFVLIPVMIFIMLLILGVSWGSWFATPCVIFVTFHMPIDAISLIFIIKPYRNFILKKFGLFRDSNNNGGATGGNRSTVSRTSRNNPIQIQSIRGVGRRREGGGGSENGKGFMVIIPQSNTLRLPPLK